MPLSVVFELPVVDNNWEVMQEMFVVSMDESILNLNFGVFKRDFYAETASDSFLWSMIKFTYQ